MPEIIDCPQCERKLRVPDDLLGLAVKCPTCGVIFTAPAPAAGPAPDRLTTTPEQASREIYPEEDAARRGEATVPAPWPRGQDEDVAPFHLRPRVAWQPHRGTLILVLGILSIALCGFLGPVAWIMGSNDLKAIRAGRMDPEGKGITNGGRICGIIGTIVNLVLPVCCGIPLTLLWLFSWRMQAHQGF